MTELGSSTTMNQLGGSVRVAMTTALFSKLHIFFQLEVLISLWLIVLRVISLLKYAGVTSLDLALLSVVRLAKQTSLARHLN